MSGLVHKTGECTVDNLIAGVFPRGDTTGITLKATKAGLVKRGTILAFSEEDGSYAPLTEETKDKASVILCDDVDVQEGDVAEGVSTAAYTAGNFNRNAVDYGEASALDHVIVNALRINGIKLTDMQE